MVSHESFERWWRATAHRTIRTSNELTTYTMINANEALTHIADTIVLINVLQLNQEKIICRASWQTRDWAKQWYNYKGC